MNLFKKKTSIFKKITNRVWLFLALFIRKIFGRQAFKSFNVDQKLVYSLSPKKIPSGRQLKYLPRFLKPNEHLIIKICLALILVNGVYLGVNFFKKHLEYLPVYGGEYVEGVVSYPRTINPLYAINREIDSDLTRLIYSSLFKYDQNGLLINDLVLDYSIENGKDYIIHLREGVKWHNGEELTADDVIFTMEAIKNDEYRSPLKGSLSEVSLEKIDELTLKISLNSPRASFLHSLTFGILPKNAWSKVSPSGAILSELNLKPIGSGPYKFKSLVKNKDGDIKEYNLIVNDNYYFKKPYISNFKFIFFINYAEAVKALNDNQIDGLSYLPLNERSELVTKDSLFFRELISPQVFGLFFNQEKDKALSDKLVRTALAQAIDKRKLISDIFNGIYNQEDGPILKSSYAYNDAIVKYDYNFEEAKTNLKGRLASTSITVIDVSRNVSVAERVKAFWEALGVKVELVIIPSEKAAEVIKNKDFEIILYGQAVGADPDIHPFWHSSQAKAGGLNIAGYNNPEADKLLTEGREISNSEERIIRYHELQKNITANLPAIFLYSPTYTYIQSKKIRGFTSSAIVEPADRFAGISDWYLKTKIKLTW